MAKTVLFKNEVFIDEELYKSMNDVMWRSEDRFTPIVDGTDHFAFACRNGHQMKVYCIFLEPEPKNEKGSGKCLHLKLMCPICKVAGQRKIYTRSGVTYPQGEFQWPGRT